MSAIATLAAPPPVVKRIVVRMDPDGAFDLFTREMSLWWPLRTHSCAGDDSVRVQVEPHVGGQIIETAKDGSRAPWGTVLVSTSPSGNTRVAVGVTVVQRTSRSSAKAVGITDR